MLTVFLLLIYGSGKVNAANEGITEELKVIDKSLDSITVSFEEVEVPEEATTGNG